MTHDYKRNGTVDLFAAMNLATGQVLHDTRRRHAGDDVFAFFKLIDLHVPRHLDVHVVLDNLFLVLPVPLALVVVEAGSAILGRQFLQMGIVDDGVAGAAGQTDGRRGAGVERQPAGIGIGNDRWAGRVSRGDDATLDDADRTRRTGTPRPGTSTLCAARLVTIQRYLQPRTPRSPTADKRVCPPTSVTAGGSTMVETSDSSTSAKQR